MIPIDLRAKSIDFMTIPIDLASATTCLTMFHIDLETEQIDLATKSIYFAMFHLCFRTKKIGKPLFQLKNPFLLMGQINFRKTDRDTQDR